MTAPTAETVVLGATSEVGPLRTVLLHRPGAELRQLRGGLLAGLGLA